MNTQKKILIIDDDEVTRDLIAGILKINTSYGIIMGKNGEDGIRQAVREMPDLIILDIMMPKIDGYQVCKILRADVVTRYIPIIMLSAKSSIDSRIKGLNIGADDYITKPFNHPEFLARLESLLRRNELCLDANPLTRLPGNISIERELMKALAENRQIAVGYADIDNFKAFNDKYGFPKGDRVIFETGHIIRDSANRADFVGHIGGDDFVFISMTADIEKICSTIITRFDVEMPKYYDDETRVRGYIESASRDGKIERFQLMTLSLAVVTNREQHFSHFAEIGEIGAELKKYLKTLPGSKYLVDRRKIPAE